MRIAALSDVHGNLPAFEAALDHVAKQSVDQIVVVGDLVIGSPDSAACWKRASELGCPIVRGNTESFVAQYGTPDADPQWDTEQFGPLQWAVQQFSAAERKILGALPLTCKLSGVSDVLFFHSSPRSEWEDLRAYTPEDQLREIFTGTTERFLVRGHHHNPQVQLWEDYVIINCGSVGLPDDCKTVAQYLLLEQYRDGWRVRHQAVAYDVEATLRRFRETGYLEAAGPMGRLLMRQVATATVQVMPFLGYYKRWRAESEITLTEAVERFLNLF